MKKLLFLALTIFLSEIMFAQSNEVTIPGSQTKTFTSSIVSGQEYVLQISLPASYDKTDQKRFQLDQYGSSGFAKKIK
jgi:hypothetical protein